MPLNSFQQPIGEPLTGFQAGALPTLTSLEGQTVRIEKLAAEHLTDLYPFYGPTARPEDFTYLSIEPFQTIDEFEPYFHKMVQSRDPYYLAIRSQETHRVIGTFSLMRIDATNRVVEVGWVLFSRELQKTRMATEAHYLLMRYVFEELSYRRYEWKCDALNQPSRKAATRLGFTYEGTFRQAVVYKERNRDTAWFSILDSEWKTNKQRLENWLADSNFDHSGQQKQSLSDL